MAINPETPAKLLKYVKENAEEGNVSSVIDTMDQYGYKLEWNMNIGDVKGKILDGIVKECNPSTALELGTYCGYSTLRIARQLKEEVKFYTVEYDEVNAAVAKEIISFAGMQDRITMLIGRSKEVLKSMTKDHGIKSFDFIFLDHWKQFYKPDIITMEQLGLVRKGTVVAADNVINPGTPDYLDYVRNNSKYECTNYLAKVQYSEKVDAVEKSVCIA